MARNLFEVKNQKKLIYSIINVFVHASLFTWFWLIALDADNLVVPIIIFSVIIILIVQDFLLGIISVLMGIAFAVVVVEVDRYFNFFDGQNLTRLYFLLTLSTLLSALLVRFFIDEKEEFFNRVSILYSLIIFAMIFLSTTLFDLMKDQSKIFALRYLVSTGEDNAAWLSGLSGGYGNSPNQFHLESSSTYAGTTTALISMSLRGVQSLNNGSYKLSDNLLSLQRLYLICMAIGVIIVSLSIFRFLVKIDTKLLSTVAISLLGGLTVYLGFTSFALYGHLTPTESSIFLFAIFALLTFKTKHKIRSVDLSKTLLPAIHLTLIYAVSESWWPLAPAMYLAMLCIAVMTVLDLLRQNWKRIFYVFICIFSIMTFIYRSSLISLIRNGFEEFTYKLHIPGGTMSLGLINLILVITVLMIISVSHKIENLSYLNSRLLRTITFSLLLYYFITILLSHVTPPFTVSYAGSKMGLFLGVVFLPIVVIFFGKLFQQKFNFAFSGFIFSIGAFCIFMVAGPPTSPTNPAWNQMGFPFGLINAIKQDPNGGWVWIKPMVAAIDENPDKKVLCFQSNQNSIDPFELNICTRFVTSIQGFDKDPITSLWYQVISNSITEEDFAKLTPLDFLSSYKVVDLSQPVEPDVEISLNNIANYLEKNNLLIKIS